MFDKEQIKALIGKAIELAKKYTDQSESTTDDLIIDALQFLFQTLSPVFGAEGEPSGGEELPVGLRSDLTAAVEEAKN